MYNARIIVTNDGVDLLLFIGGQHSSNDAHNNHFQVYNVSSGTFHRGPDLAFNVSAAMCAFSATLRRVYTFGGHGNTSRSAAVSHLDSKQLLNVSAQWKDGQTRLSVGRWGGFAVALYFAETDQEFIYIVCRSHMLSYMYSTSYTMYHIINNT